MDQDELNQEELESQRRIAVWKQKSNRLRALKTSAKSPLKTVDENSSPKEDPSAKQLWINNADQKDFDKNQLAYAKKYQADYHDFDRLRKLYSTNQFSQDEGDDNSQQQLTSNPNSSDTQAESTTSSTSEPSERGLRSRRGRLAVVTAFSANPRLKNTVANECTLECTSTIMAPTEFGVGDDFNSNVDVETLRKTYFRNYKTNSSLPIHINRANIIDSINSYSVVIIQGQTGCGKTTQVPAYILEDAILDRKTTKAPVVYVTQPRRIAAKSIATRVAIEHDWDLGTVVGYQVGLEKNIGSDTILVFCTAGVLLQKLIHEKSLKNYSHIVIDEAHERDADTDLLMMMIRTLMRHEVSSFRLIVMSATIELTKLRNYFTFKTTFGHNDVSVPSICRVSDGVRPANEVQIVYMDKLGENFRIDHKLPQFDFDEPDIHDECLNVAVRIIVEDIPNLDIFNYNTQTVLVFLPGLAEITKLHRLLDQTNAPLDIIPLHSTLPYSDQNRIFLPSFNGYRKVILATNIAESSITVKDAGFVVDFCLTKTLKKDQTTKFPMLKLDWCTKDKLIQRAGRTGRCCPGKVFRLITSAFYKKLHEFSEPELLVSPLELSVLKVKTFDMGEIKALLAVVLDPPPLKEIKTAVLELKQIGAMTANYKGKLSDEDGELTELGKVIARLPIDVHLSKLIVVASLLDVLEPAIIVAASLSSNRHVVKHQYENVFETYKNKLDWAQGAQSDLFVSLNVYNEYIHHKDDLNKDLKFMERYCNNRHLDERKLEEISALKKDLIFRLEAQNIKILDQPNRERNAQEDEIMLRVAFCAAFYPNYFVNQELDANDIEKELSGFDPSRTVLISGFPVGSVPLYRSQVMPQLDEYGNRRLEYFADHSRAYIRIDDTDPNDDEDLMNTDEESIFRTLGINPGNVQYNGNSEVKLRKSFCNLLRAGQQDDMSVREYRPDAARSRMEYYLEARSQIVIPRLVPTMFKLVDGPADNSHLTDTDDEEYMQVIRNHYYTEVTFNQEQDDDDMRYLTNLMREEDQVKSFSNRTQRRSTPREDEVFGDLRRLRGPYSPIQMKFVSVLNRSKGFNVDICPNSVNSLLLDLNYSTRRRQMLVAASVGQTQKSNRIIIRDTTLMFNVMGLPSLMSLLFARTLRLIYNEKLQSYSGAIFSLGWDEEDKPLRTEYQVELEFDVRFTQSDFAVINRARRVISKLIQYLDIHNPGAPEFQLKLELRDSIKWLIKQERVPMVPIDLALIDWKSGCFVKDLANQDETLSLVKLPDRDSHLFLPPIQTTKEIPDYAMIELIRKNLNKLDKIEKNETPMGIGGVQCLLCSGGLGQLFILKSKLIEHVWSDFHIKRLRELEIIEMKAAMKLSEEDQDLLENQE